MPIYGVKGNGQQIQWHPFHSCAHSSMRPAVSNMGESTTASGWLLAVGFWWPQTCDGICFSSITQQAEKDTGRVVESCFPIGNKWKSDHAWVEEQQLHINNKTLIPPIRLKQMRHTFSASLNISLAILWRLKMLMVLTSWNLYDC